MRKGDAAVALVTVAFGVFVATQARRLGDPGLDALGPTAIPTALGLIIAACGAVLLAGAVAGRRGEDRSPARWGLLASTLALLLAYVHAIEWLGFPLVTALFAAACLALLGARGAPRLALSGLAISLVVTLAFGRLLGVDLPAGRLFGG